jgi:hypothetical protein
MNTHHREHRRVFGIALAIGLALWFWKLKLS